MSAQGTKITAAGIKSKDVWINGQKVVVVEDLISTGGCVIDAVDAHCARQEREVIGIVSIFTYGMQKGLDRLAEAKIKNISLTNFDVIAQVAAEDGLHQA